MINGKIEFINCWTLTDVELAVNEALKLINEGNTWTPGNSNESGGYKFDLSGDEEDYQFGWEDEESNELIKSEAEVNLTKEWLELNDYKQSNQDTNQWVKEIDSEFDTDESASIKLGRWNVYEGNRKIMNIINLKFAREDIVKSHLAAFGYPDLGKFKDDMKFSTGQLLAEIISEIN